MDKSTARAKHAASLRGRRRFSRRNRPHSSSSAVDPLWSEFENVLPLEELEEEEEDGAGGKKLDYEELLSRDPFSSLGLSASSSIALSSAGRDHFEDLIADMYAAKASDGSSPDVNLAALLSPDLDMLTECLQGLSLSKRLFLDDETLPSELLRDVDASDTEDSATSLQQGKQEEAAEALARNKEVDEFLRNPELSKLEQAVSAAGYDANVSTGTAMAELDKALNENQYKLDNSEDELHELLADEPEELKVAGSSEMAVDEKGDQTADELDELLKEPTEKRTTKSFEQEDVRRSMGESGSLVGGKGKGQENAAAEAELDNLLNLLSLDNVPKLATPQGELDSLSWLDTTATPDATKVDINDDFDAWLNSLK